jgi:hypothetical protein
MRTVLANVGAVVTAMLGLLGLLAPRAVGAALGLRPHDRLGVSELRATYGGFFAALGVGCLLLQTRVAFALVGAGWCGAAIARWVSIVREQHRSVKNVVGALFEASMGALMLAAPPSG